MELLSALSLGELALSFSRVPLFPVFDLSYFIVSILYLKYEPGEPGPEAGEDWHCGEGDGGRPRGLEEGKGLNRGGTVPGTGLGKQAGAGIMGFSHTGPGRGKRRERARREAPEIVGLGEGKQMQAGGKERNVIAQRRGNRCWGGCRERRSGVRAGYGRRNLGEGRRSW